MEDKKMEMESKTDYRMLRLFSQGMGIFGWAVMAFYFLTCVILGVKFFGGFLGFLQGIIGGIVTGLPFLVAGELIKVFLDQRELLESINRKLPYPQPDHFED